MEAPGKAEEDETNNTNAGDALRAKRDDDMEREQGREGVGEGGVVEALEEAAEDETHNAEDAFSKT